MLFWIFVIILVVGAIVSFLYSECLVDSNVSCCVGTGGLAVGVIGVIVSIIVMACNFIGIDGNIAANKIRYETLVYQYENDIYDNDNDLGKRELMVDIQNWNENLAANQELQDDRWVGIYIPDIYDQFEFIELDKGE